jgi:DNA-binding response OmpR family regulator
MRLQSIPMDFSQQRPSERIRVQQDIIRQQDAIIEMLKGALAALGCEKTPAAEPWVEGLTSQERALVGALYARFPRAIDRYDLLEMLPGRGRTDDRQSQLVTIVVHNVRQKLGASAIVTEHGLGYRMSAECFERMRAETAEEVRLAA